MNYHDYTALDAGTTRKVQDGDWSYMADLSNNRIMRMVRSDPVPGTSAAAERIVAIDEAERRNLTGRITISMTPIREWQTRTDLDQRSDSDTIVDFGFGHEIINGDDDVELTDLLMAAASDAAMQHLRGEEITVNGVIRVTTRGDTRHVTLDYGSL